VVVTTRTGTTRACLVDVYDTILDSSWHARARAIAELAGVPAEQWVAEWGSLSGERDRGALTMGGAFAKALAACGRDADPGLITRLIAADAGHLGSDTVICDDTEAFFTALRSRGIAVALVSNCADNTRPMLAARGILAMVDAAILSCEVGVSKPDPEIYLMALQSLGVLGADAVFLDDQPKCCDGAEKIGVRAIQVVRPGIASQPADPRFTPVTSLLDALPLL
jgi:FMN phosphatase YigB (HAD superfamily)